MTKNVEQIVDGVKIELEVKPLVFPETKFIFHIKNGDGVDYFKDVEAEVTLIREGEIVSQKSETSHSGILVFIYDHLPGGVYVVEIEVSSLPTATNSFGSRVAEFSILMEEELPPSPGTFFSEKAIYIGIAANATVVVGLIAFATLRGRKEENLPAVAPDKNSS
ncbi:MAG: hypothetical protein ABIH76_07680 [Candidatus Bathyarchaeota archaeon]